MNKPLWLTSVLLLFIIIGAMVPGAPVSASVMWSEDWDSYATGQNIHGESGWKGWDNDASYTAFTSNAQYVSSPNSIAITGSSDLVHEFPNYAINQWVFTTKVFVPSDYSGTSYFILLDEYSDGGPYNWLTQVHFDSADNYVRDDRHSGILPLIKDQWVEICVIVDINSDTTKFYYGGNLLYEGDEAGVYGYDIQTVEAIDLFANWASPVYYDNLSVRTLDAPDLSLTPETDSNPIGTTHTVTATYSGLPQQGVQVSIEVTDGPNTGTGGASWTNANGQVTLTYSGTTVGTDTITATAIDVAGATIATAEATKVWTEGGTPPGPGLEVGGEIYPNNSIWILVIGVFAVALLSGAGILIKRKVSNK